MIAGVALVSGDPVGDARASGRSSSPSPASRSGAAGCSASSGAGPTRLSLWRAAGLRAHYTGDEAIVSRQRSRSRAVRSARYASPSRGWSAPATARRCSRATRSTSRSRPRSTRSPRAGAAIATRPATRWRSPARASWPARNDLYVIARDRGGEPRGFLHFGVVPVLGIALALEHAARARHAERPQRVPDLPGARARAPAPASTACR